MAVVELSAKANPAGAKAIVDAISAVAIDSLFFFIIKILIIFIFK
ncbi:hypothetical protein OENI_360003 [Oenococcus oeni]|nr:hypothetical protein OENI_360003 [Oenococcus oeni]